MAQGFSKWWNKFQNQADALIWERSHYYKEKYGWFRVELYWDYSPTLEDKLIELEEESYKCCQICSKHRKQFRTNWWWIEHFCFPCYVKVCIKHYRKKFIYKIKTLWKKIV